MDFPRQNKFIWKEMNNMREVYIAPEAEVIRFVAEENIANTEPTSVLDWAVSNDENKDGIINADKWFGPGN